MKILKSLFLFISIYAVFVGCSKKSDPVTPACYVNTYTYVDGSYSKVNTYTYTNNKIVKISAVNSSGTTSTYNYSYDAQGRVASLTSSSTTGSSTSTDSETFTYDTNGRLIQILSATTKVVITYNSSGQMVKKDYYTLSGSTSTLNYSFAYTYPSTNTKNYSTQMDYNGANTLQATITYVYDTKQNPEAVMFPDNPEPTNNPTQETYQYPGGTPSVVTYTYTYNDNGFPLTITEIDGSYTYTTTYTYTNCK